MGGNEQAPSDPDPAPAPAPASDAISVVHLLISAPFHMPEEEDDTRIDGPGKSKVAKVEEGTAPEAGRKKRGRPLGSKNKPKPPIYLNHNCGAQPVVLEVASGSDIIDSITQYAIRRRKCVCIITGHGAVSNVALTNPAPHESTFTIHGHFNILSLSGFFLPSPRPPSLSSPSSSTSSSLPPRSPIAIALTGTQGHLLGGTVSGALIAATTVSVVVATFDNPSFHRLPYEEEDGDDARPTAMAATAAIGGSMPLSFYGVIAPIPINCQIPAEMFPNMGRPPLYM